MQCPPSSDFFLLDFYIENYIVPSFSNYEDAKKYAEKIGWPQTYVHNFLSKSGNIWCVAQKSISQYRYEFATEVVKFSSNGSIRETVTIEMRPRSTFKEMDFNGYP